MTSFAPLIIAINFAMETRQLSMQHKYALMEGCLALYRNILPRMRTRFNLGTLGCHCDL